MGVREQTNLMDAQIRQDLTAQADLAKSSLTAILTSLLLFSVKGDPMWSYGAVDPKPFEPL